ncbi:MMPL family transporter [Nonomuraea sp. NPDC050556]|uniref:MMPL family transporter n=1 Tax=Nonomuraea sp. NPDC050556 TaxID=3364369 RepID=UPI0037AFB3B6
MRGIPPIASLLYRIGLGSFRHRFAVLTIWVLVLLASGVGAATLAGKTVDSFNIPGQESSTALELMGKHYGKTGDNATAQVVLKPASQTAQISKVVQQLGRLPGVVGASDPFDRVAPGVSPNGQVAYTTVTYATQPADITAAQRQALLDVLGQARASGLTAEVTGKAIQAGPQLGGPAEAIGVVVALIVLAITYGSLVVAGMNLLTAIVGVAIGALGIVTLTGLTDLQSTTPILAVMLGLAVGIDYTLFIVTRYRQELLQGRSHADAAAMAVGTAGSAVVTAGITVVIALAGLAVAGIPFLTEMGLAAAATVVIAALIAITLVPATLGLLGSRVRPGRTPRGERGFYQGWARLVTRHRWLTLAAAVAALAAVSVPVLSMRTSLIASPTPGSTQANATRMLADNFGPGFTGPLLILAEGDEAVRQAESAGPLIARLPGFATPARPSSDGSAALITFIPASSPESKATADLVRDLRQKLAELDSGGTRFYVTGTTAINVDVSRTLDSALPIYLALVVGLALVLLVLVFRSLLVPLIGVLGFLLTVGASLGATTAVFQWGWLKDVVQVESTGPLLSLAPIIIIGILFGLAMDYQVFLVSRMHEAHSHGQNPRDAIVTGFRQAAPVVIAAASIMFAVFAGFVPEGDATIKPIAFALALGILVDAVIVRMIAMPAALSLLGEAAWWLPRWLRWLPVVDAEGAALDRPAVKDQRPAQAGRR